MSGSWVPGIADIVSNTVGSLVASTIIFVGGFLAFRRFRERILAFKYAWRMSANGIVNFYCSRADYLTARTEANLEQYILRANHSFVYVGHYLASGTENSKLDGSLRTLLDRGCKVEIDLLHEKTDPTHLAFLEEFLSLPNGQLQGRLRKAHQHFSLFQASLPKRLQRQFALKRHKKPITCSAFLIDIENAGGFMLIDSKIYAGGRDKSYGIEFERVDTPRSLFTEFLDSMNAIRASAN